MFLVGRVASSFSELGEDKVWAGTVSGEACGKVGGYGPGDWVGVLGTVLIQKGVRGIVINGQG